MREMDQNDAADQNDTVDQNQNTEPEGGQGTGGKTFTQEQLNSILQERLAKEKEKHEKELADMRLEMKKHEMQLEAKDKLKEAKLSEELIELVRFDNDEAFNRSLNLLRKVMMRPAVAYRPKRGTTHDYDEIGEAMGLRE